MGLHDHQRCTLQSVDVVVSNINFSPREISCVETERRSVNCVLTTIPIGVLAQEFYTLTLP